MCRLVTVVLLALLGCYPDQGVVQAALSIPKASDATGPRAAGIAALHAAIQNEPRTISIGDQEFPFYNGPIPRPDSLAEKIRLEEAAALTGNQTQLVKLVAQTASSQVNQGKVTSMESIVSIYDLVTDQLPKPMSTDISDPTFGQERLTTKAMRLRQVRRDEYRETAFELTDAQVSKICGPGVTWRNILERRLRPREVRPQRRGLLCYNSVSCQFLPIDIQYPDTGLSYTPFDSKDQWTLAKIGLDAASVVFHQWAHFSDTHAMASPIRVELFRNMAPEHPIGAMVEHHQYIDHGIELLVMTVLLAPKTPIDLVFGWGGKCSARFVHNYLHTQSSLKNDLPTDLQRRGLNDIPHHKYAQYGSKFYNAIDSFVKRYIDVYYKSDFAVKNDFELQN